MQYRTVEEQLFKAMQSLFDQKQRHGVARLVGMRAPLNIVTPTVEAKPTTKKMSDSFLTRVYEKLPFALRSAEAQKLIEDRHQKIVGATQTAASEPIAVRRRIQ